MVWTIDDIEVAWLLGGRLAVGPDVTVESFNRADRMLGAEWIRSCGSSRGLGPTLHVVTMGQQLAVLGDTAGASKLIDAIVQGDTSAEAELTALNIVTFQESGMDFELFPEFIFQSNARISDFRVRRDSEPWIYVEVTQPESSEAHNRAEAALSAIVGMLGDIKIPLALEVFLRREPEDEDLELLVREVPEFCKLDGVQKAELPNDLGILMLNRSEPGQAVFDPPAEVNASGIVTIHAIKGPDEPHRHVLITMPFSDARAASFLQKEARQLPDDTPGLVMVELREPGFETWERALLNIFKRGKYKWVSGVCLFRSGLNLTDQGEAWLPETSLIVNSGATLALPQWTVDQLSGARGRYRKALGLD